MPDCEASHNAAELRREKAMAADERWAERWRMDDEWRREQTFGQIDDDICRIRQVVRLGNTADFEGTVDRLDSTLHVVFDAWDDLPADLRERIEEMYKDRVAEKGA